MVSIPDPRRLVTYSIGNLGLWPASSPVSFQESINYLRLNQVAFCCFFTILGGVDGLGIHPPKLHGVSLPPPHWGMEIQVMRLRSTAQVAMPSLFLVCHAVKGPVPQH